VEKINIVEYDEIRAGIDKIKAECDFLPDVSTKEGYEKSRRLALDHGKVLSKLEAVRKERKSYWLEGGKQVDSQAKAIKAEIEEAIGPHKDAYKNLDNAKKEREKARVAALEERVQFIVNLPGSMQDSSSDEVMAAIEGLNSEECLDFYEFTMQALEARKASQQKLADLYRRVKKSEDEAEELAELRRLQEEMARIDREEKIKREASAKAEAEKQEAINRQMAAEQAKIDAERRAIEAEKAAKAEHEKASSRAIEAEKQAKINADIAAKNAREAEIKRQEEANKAEQEEIAKREANKKHVGAVRKAAKEAIMLHGVDEATAKALVLAINKGDIPNVLIKY
jgi:colicin import membrane protein